nr:hypothetical protein [Candidatus Cloacimonadota bacterium]
MKKRAFLVVGLLLLFAASLLAESKSNLQVFEISPNPMKDKCAIELAFAQETEIILTIENQRGQVIRTIYSGAISKSETFIWEREDDYGNWVMPGEYSVVINYQSRYTSTKKTLILK